MFVVYLDELHFGELFDIRHQRDRDVVQRAVRLTRAREIDVRDAIGIFDAAVASESVQHERKPLIALHAAGTFEEFIERCADKIER